MSGIRGGREAGRQGDQELKDLDHGARKSDHDVQFLREVEG